MSFRIGVETGFEGRVIAWALEHPGCFAYGGTQAEALANLPGAIRDYIAWVAAHTPDPWVSPVLDEIQVEETWHAYMIDSNYEFAEEGYEVNSWFRHDWKPLTAQDVERALKLISWSRVDLLACVHGLSQEVLQNKRAGERWNILGVLGHVGGSEWWYMDMLGLAFPRDELPAEPFERLAKVRAHLAQVLPTLVGSTQVVGVKGEFWSPRKLVRRAVWHERDHVDHILKLKV